MTTAWPGWDKSRGPEERRRGLVGIAPWTPCPAVKGRSLDGMGEIKAAVHGVGASTCSHDPREAGAETVAGLARRFWKGRRLSALWASEDCLLPDLGEKGWHFSIAEGDSNLALPHLARQ